MLEIIPVPAFADNYIWLVRDEQSGETAVVDPGDSAPVLAECERRDWTITQIWNTHWHPDHTGGNVAIKQATIAANGACTISGPAAETVAGIDVKLAEGDPIRIGEHVGETWEIPGHTRGHVALVFERERIAFVGDTLFAMGCGRLFEGTPQQMFDSLKRLMSLAPDTMLYCGHEYTLANARFAIHAEPGNAEVKARLADVTRLRQQGAVTLPTSVAAERATNPFVRVSSWQDFARLRAEKDSFR